MKLKINIPSKLSEITLEQYQKYLQLLEDNEDEAVNSIFFRMKLLEIFCGIPYPEMHNIRVKDVEEIVQIIFDTLDNKPDLVLNFQMGDTEFGFVPNLEDMTFGEYIDLDNHIGDWKNIHKAMAVLYRPIEHKKGDKYIIQEYKGDNYHDIMKYMPLDAVFGSIVFFYHLGIDCTKGMTNYLEEQAKQEGFDKALDISGVGINQYTHLLREILDDLKVSLD